MRDICINTPGEPDVPTLRGEITALSLFGGRRSLSKLILFSLFLTDILMLGLIIALSLSAALLVNSCFVPCFVAKLIAQLWVLLGRFLQ